MNDAFWYVIESYKIHFLPDIIDVWKTYPHKTLEFLVYNIIFLFSPVIILYLTYIRFIKNATK